MSEGDTLEETMTILLRELSDTEGDLKILCDKLILLTDNKTHQREYDIYPT